MTSGVTTICEHCNWQNAPIEGCLNYSRCPVKRSFAKTTEMMGTDPATAAEWDALKAENAALREALEAWAIWMAPDTRHQERYEKNRRLRVAKDATRAALKHGKE